MTLEELKVVISAETAGLEKGLSKVKSSISGLTKTVSRMSTQMTHSFKSLGNSISNSFKSLTKIAGLTLGIAGLTKLGKAAINTASDLTEVQNVVDVVFGSSANEVNAWAKSCLKSFGLTEYEAKQAASSYKAMANSMGLLDNEGKAVSIQLTELAGDLSSFYNTSIDTATTALKSIFTGETETLKKFGVVMTETNLNAYAMAQGITKSYSQMSQAEKVALRYKYALAVTADAQGDFARSSNSWANQVKVLRGQWSSFLSVLGTGLTQTLAPIIKALNTVLAQIITIAKALFSLIGVNFSASAASVSSTADAAEGIAEGFDDAEGSAKKLQKTLAGFDELETLNPKDSGGGAGGAGSGSSLAIEDASISMGKVDDTPLFTSFNDAMAKLKDWFDNKMTPWLVESAEKVATSVNNWFSGVNWTGAGSTIAAGLNGLFAALDTFWTELNGYLAGHSIGELITGFFENWNAATAAKAFSEKFKTVLDFAIGLLEGTDNTVVGEAISTFLTNIQWNDIAEKLGRLLSDIIIAALNLATGIITGSGTAEESGSTVFESFTSGFDAEGVRTAFEGLKTAIEETNSPLATTIQNLQSAIDKLNEVITVLGIITAIGLSGKLLTITGFLGSFITALGAGRGIIGAFSDATIILGNDALAGLVKMLGTTESSLGAFGSKIAAFVTGPVGIAIAAIAAVVAGIVLAYKNNEDFRKQVDNFWKNTVKPFLEFVTDGIKNIWENVILPLWEAIQPIIRGMMDILSDLLQVVGIVVAQVIMFINERIIPILKVLFGAVQSVLEGVATALTGFWENGFMPILDGIKTALSGFIDFLTGIFTGDWKKAWEGVKTIFKGVWDTFTAIVKAPINGIIGLVNGMITGIVNGLNRIIECANSLSWTVPDWVPLIGGQDFGFHFKTITAPSIPYLAKGGVITKPTYAMLGEYAGAGSNPEIVSPRSQIEAIIDAKNDDLVSVFSQFTRQIIAAINEVDMEVSIGDDVIAQSAARGNNRYKARNGVPLFSV